MNNFIICATRSMRGYASRVVRHLSQIPGFSEYADSMNGVDLLSTDHFADGEMEVELTSSIRGRDIVLFCTCARNEAGIGVEQAKIELYHAIDSLKRSQAHKIIVFEPFISCSRSDRTTRRNSVGLWVHFKILSSLGADHIVTYQLHSDKSKTMIDPSLCLVDDIPALPLLEKYLFDYYIQSREILENVIRNHWAFCSVDAGGEKIARSFANAFGAPLVVAHKQRDYSKPNKVSSISILSAEPLEGKVLWIVDDMVDTGVSVERLIPSLKPLNPREINLIAVHALFSPPAAQRMKALAREGLLNNIIITDTVCHLDVLKQDIPGLKIVSSAELSAHVIQTIITNSSMNTLLQPFDAGAYLSPPRDD